MTSPSGLAPGLGDLLCGLRAFAIPMRTRFRGITVREGALIEGPAGWGEFSPFAEYGPRECARWLACALEAATQGWPEPVRSQGPVNVTVPAVGPGQAHVIVRASGCRTAKVKVAERPPGGEAGGPGAGRGAPGNGGADSDRAGSDGRGAGGWEDSIRADVARVEAVRDALGPGGKIRVDANGAWDVNVAARALRELSAFGLEYAEQPCATLPELAELRRRVDIPLAADESVRRAEDPLAVRAAGAADIVVIKAQPLGGVRASLRVADACGLPVVVSSAVETSVGLAAGTALAAALPDLPFACGLATMSLLTGDVTGDPLAEHGGALDVRRPVVNLARWAQWEIDPAPWRARAAAAAEYLERG